MKDKARKIKKQTGASRDYVSCVRRHPIPALFFTFLGGMGIGAFMASKIMKGREQRAEGERKQGGIAPLLMTLITPYIIRRILRMITG